VYLRKKHIISITKTDQLMLFGEIIAVYCENFINPQINPVDKMHFFYFKAGGVLCYKWLNRVIK
jgi:hypothetical protein